MSDFVRELSKEITQQIAEAHDKGAMNMMDTVIELADASGGQVTIQQLRNFKDYVARNLAKEKNPLTVDQLLQTVFPQDYPWPLVPVDDNELLRVNHFAATVGLIKVPKGTPDRNYQGMCTCGWTGVAMYGKHNAYGDAARHIQTHNVAI